MTRQEKLKEIGNMEIDKYALKFIIPIPHKFYDNSSDVFNDIESLDWKINNKSKEILLGGYNIKTYIYENMILPLKDKSKFLVDFCSLYLSKEINQKFSLNTIFKDKNITFEFELTNLDLWVFEEHIGFFVLDIKLNKTNPLIDEIVLFNRVFREFKYLSLQKTNSKIILLNTEYIKSYDFVEYLLDFTKKDKKSFLNIQIGDIKEKDDNYFNTIYNTTTNAKLLIGIQIKNTAFLNNQLIKEDNQTNINEDIAKTMSILEEIPFYIATCSYLDNSDKSFIYDDSYIYKIVQNQGVNLWKYSSGIVLHDSFALVGLANDGGPVVNNVNNSFYFVYMLNLYIYFQIRYIERKIIDKHFESREIAYLYKKLQKLKNQFITEDIAIKFQENEINKITLEALKTNQILSEVTNNLVETKQITDNNLGLYISLGGFAFVSVFQESLQEFFKNHTLPILAIGVPLAGILYINRHRIEKWLKL